MLYDYCYVAEMYFWTDYFMLRIAGLHKLQTYELLQTLSTTLSTLIIKNVLRKLLKFKALHIQSNKSDDKYLITDEVMRFENSHKR